MPDITMCRSNDCPKRSHCYRAQAKPDKLQSYSDFSAECFQYNFLRFWSMSGEFDEMNGLFQMRWLINYIRSCFCKHDWELIFDTQVHGEKLDGSLYEYPLYCVKTYRCKKNVEWRRNIKVLNKFPIMHLIGSTKIENEQQFVYAEKYYTKNGYIVFKPVFFGLDKNDKRLSMYTDMCTQKLNMCDVVCVVTEHIGESTRKRIEQARELGKEIIYFNLDE